jgi:hypothetical protein
MVATRLFARKGEVFTLPFEGRSPTVPSIEFIRTGAAAGRIQEAARQERGHGCPRSDLESAQCSRNEDQCLIN